MTERIRIKVGQIELEWESDGSLTLDNVKSLLRNLEALAPASSPQPSAYAAPPPSEKNKAAPAAGTQQKLFVTTIAAKVAVKGPSDLARAAAAYLQFTEGKQTFSRQDLLETMKKAPAYFNENVRKNLSRIITALIPGTFNQVGNDAYSLTASQYAELEKVLAEH